uniref:Uncharacterized protein n=1 Tax=Rhizophora mucronata TaxID=61149 RepID=A0A2P2PZ02_RHIMU
MHCGSHRLQNKLYYCGNTLFISCCEERYLIRHVKY